MVLITFSLGTKMKVHEVYAFVVGPTFLLPVLYVFCPQITEDAIFLEKNYRWTPLEREQRNCQCI
jgi:hypothetical protein